MDITNGWMTFNATDIPNGTSLLQQEEQKICKNPSSRNTTVAEYIACLIAFVTIMENCVILVAICRGSRSLRKPPYWFIANLAVADTLTGLGVLMAVFMPIGNSPSSRIALKGFAVVTFIVSINSLLFVSFDRYIRIVRHSNYKKFLSRRKILGMIAFSWIISVLLFLIIPLTGWSCGSYHCCAHDGLCTCLRSKYGENICGALCSQSFVPFQKSYLLVGVLYFVIAVTAMNVFYAVIFRVVKKKTFSENKSQTNKLDRDTHASEGSRFACIIDEDPHSSNGNVNGTGRDWLRRMQRGTVTLRTLRIATPLSLYERREINLAKTLVITLGIFVICWLPVVALFIADLASRQQSVVLVKAFDFALVPTVINSFLNPIIYSIRMPRVRATIQRLFLPCLYPGSGNRGTSWVSSTSNEKRSTRNFSIRRKSRRRGQPSASSSTGLKDQIVSKAGQQCEKSVA